MKPKLSPAQLRVLRALGKESLYKHFDFPWYLEPGGRSISATIRFLEEKKFLGFTYNHRAQIITAVITPAGREYLEKLEVKP
jgi:hypothetical protein